MDSPGGRRSKSGAPERGTPWRGVEAAFRAYASADDEDDRAFELAREHLQAQVIEYVGGLDLRRREEPSGPPE